MLCTLLIIVLSEIYLVTPLFLWRGNATVYVHDVRSKLQEAHPILVHVLTTAVSKFVCHVHRGICSMLVASSALNGKTYDFVCDLVRM